MVEHQSCASMVNASAFCAVGQDMKGDHMNSIGEVLAELQREKKRNAELMERISALEAQIQERNKEPLPAGGQGCRENTEAERRVKKFKRQKVEASSIDGSGDANNIKKEMEPPVMHDARCMQPKDKIPEDGLVNWMSMDETQFRHFEKLKDSDSIVECAITDESDDEDYSLYEEDGISIDRIAADKVHEHDRVNDGTHTQLGITSSSQNARTSLRESQKRNDSQNSGCVLTDGERKHEPEETEKTGGLKEQTEVLFSANEISNTGAVSISHNRKPPKVAFCPKEVKRIMESEQLLLRNAQSHTIRKIIVFASLGIRHGCEDMYDLDFNHFRILSKGEPYFSPKNPGEHVLYVNPGGRKKVFYPNGQNPTLCPVQILEEEKNMRPSDTSCPSCLFLCIKYGGKTRNLPQNEYVRQRMGRNKLKSFGPVMCRMAMLVNIRSGSFFFKALGITLLFMAGFPDDLVQRETKYRNLDLLQKYYRRDEDAEGEELFLPRLLSYDTANISPQKLRAKTNSAKPKGKKQTHSTTKPQSLPEHLKQESTPSSSAPSTPFGVMSYNSIHTHAMAANNTLASSGTNASYRNETPYHMFPQQLTNGFMPMMFWPPPSSFPPCPYPSYGFRPFPSTGNYMAFHQQPYYGRSLVPEMAEGNGKSEVGPEDSESESSSSSGQKPTGASCKQ